MVHYVTETLGQQNSISVAPKRYLIRSVRDPRVLATALSEDRPLAAYALGHLEHDLLNTAVFYIADGPKGKGVVMHAHGMGVTTAVIGAPDAINAIISIHPGPRRSYLSTATPEHLPFLQRWFRIENKLSMLRMSTTRLTFEPVNGSVRRLSGLDVELLNKLYASEGGPSFFRAETINRAVYFGAFYDRELVAAAGSHIVAPNFSIGVVGNVFTSPSYRGHGLATLTTSSVTETLLSQGCSDVVLTVDPNNEPAIHAYRRLGYEFGSEVVEAQLRRTDILGIGPTLRRRAALLRGRSLEPPGTEVVSGLINP